MARAGGITNAVNVGIAVQADWENREFISHISLNVRRLFDFLVQFEATTKSKLASLNEKLDSLERKLELLEVQRESDAVESSVPSEIPPSQTEADSATGHGQLPLHVSTYGFRQPAVGDQQLMIEEMLSTTKLEGGVIRTPAETHEKDSRINTFAELFGKLPQFSRVLFFQELTQRFFQRELVFWFRLLCSHDQ